MDHPRHRGSRHEEIVEPRANYYSSDERARPKFGRWRILLVCMATIGLCLFWLRNWNEFVDLGGQASVHRLTQSPVAYASDFEHIQHSSSVPKILFQIPAGEPLWNSVSSTTRLSPSQLLQRPNSVSRSTAPRITPSPASSSMPPRVLSPLALSPGVVHTAAIVLFCYDRPDYLQRTLKELLSARHQAVTHARTQGRRLYTTASANTSVLDDVAEVTSASWPIYISHQSGGSRHDAVESVITHHVDGFSVFRLSYTPDLASVLNSTEIRDVNKHLLGYRYIAHHYGFALGYIFDRLEYPRVIVLEDDLSISPDFFGYFSSLTPLLEHDNHSQILCVSAYHDNARYPTAAAVNASVSSQDAPPLASQLDQTHVFPGLGWMLLRRLWSEELREAWPQSYWDDWLRGSGVTRGRVSVQPRLPRTHTFGEVGVSPGTRGYYSLMLKPNAYAGATGAISNGSTVPFFVDWDKDKLSWFNQMQPLTYRSFIVKSIRAATVNRELVTGLAVENGKFARKVFSRVKFESQLKHLNAPLTPTSPLANAPTARAVIVPWSELSVPPQLWATLWSALLQHRGAQIEVKGGRLRGGYAGILKTVDPEPPHGDVYYLPQRIWESIQTQSEPNLE